MDDIARREAEQREREARERQAQVETHAGNIHLHQPVAVAPKVQIHNFNGFNGLSQQSKPPYSGFDQTLPSLIHARPQQEAEAAQRLQQQPPQPNAQIGPSPQPSNYGPPQSSLTPAQQPILNDALSYLDQVKVQFAEVPDVYNRFLDIMKDFKSSAIDTPGVIDRVSALFAGNPGLIQGFNTFLPPGYKIECGTGEDPNTIRVTTPMGTTMQRIPAARPLSPRSHPPNGSAQNIPMNERSFAEQMAAANQQQQQGGNLPEVYLDAQGRQVLQPMMVPQGANLGAQDGYRDSSIMGSQIDQRGVAQLQSAANIAPTMDAQARAGILGQGDGAGQSLNGIASIAQQTAGGAGAEKRGPVEFNHAISYVNKIKNRFASQPDIYKQFLEILQTYQRESKPIQDVYAQVTRLFETAPDLLEDFKQFLPETAAHAKAAAGQRAAGEDAFPLNGMGRQDYQHAAPLVQQAQHLQQTPAKNEAPRLPPMGNFAPTPSANRDNNKRKRQTEKNGPAPVMAPMTQPDLQGRSAAPQPSNPNKRAKHQQAAKTTLVPDAAPISPSLVPALPLPMPPNFSTSPTTEDINFFDRVRKHLNNKATYTEFLKLVNVFTQDLCTGSWVVYRAQSFIGNNKELFTWFKNFVGAEPEEEILENKPVPPTGRVALSNCRGLGPSYRLLPKMEQNKLCSGRDQLCQEVLNDEWVSHPTWASEDSGFVAHRKNQYEEGLHRIEEERHDYDTHIGVVERTIQQLEPIAQQLAHMAPEARNTLTLDEYIGGQSKAIYRRAIFKIYGRESGNNVIKKLLSDPYSCVPVLLQRCKQMREQWKAGQREWNKVWRAQINSMFWRSLDHQGAGSRQDRRQFTLKYIQAELLAKDEEQKKARDNRMEVTPSFQLETTFADTAVVYDCFTLLLVHINYKAEAQDQPKLEPFLREFASVFFGLDPNGLRDTFGAASDEASQNDAESMSLDDAPTRPRPSNRKSGNLLRGVLERGRNGRSKRDNEESIASDSRGSSPEPAAQQDEEMIDAATGAVITPPPEESAAAASRPDAPRWMQHPPIENLPGNKNHPKPDEPYRRYTYNLYANWTIYNFFRLFSLLYERLHRIKQYEPEVHKTVARESINKPANDIGWIEKMPADFFEGTGSPDTNYYNQMLAKFEMQIRESSPDLAADVEETLRRFYLYFGWQLYNCEKLVGNAVKGAIGIVGSDTKDNSSSIWNAYRKDRLREETTHNEELHYRKQAEKLAKDSDLIRVSYDETTRTARTKLLRKTDKTFTGTANTPLQRWQEYLAAYGLLEPTETIDYDSLTLPVLRKNLPSSWSKTAAVPVPTGSGPGSVVNGGSTAGSTNGAALAMLNDSDLISEEQLQTRIAFQKYGLSFQAGTKDFSYRRGKRLVVEELSKQSEELKALGMMRVGAMKEAELKRATTQQQQEGVDESSENAATAAAEQLKDVLEEGTEAVSSVTIGGAADTEQKVEGKAGWKDPVTPKPFSARDDEDELGVEDETMAMESNVRSTL